MGSQVRWQLLTQVLSFCEEEEEEARGERGGREEGKMLKS